MAISSDDTFVLCQCNDKVHMIDIASGETLGTFTSAAEEDPVQCIALSSNNEDLVISSKGLMMKLCSVSGKKGLKQWKGHNPGANVMKFHPEGSFLVAACPDTTVTLWDVHNKVLSQTFNVDSIPLCIAFHPVHSELVAVGDQVGTVTLYHTGSKNVLYQLKNHFSHCTSLCFTPDGGRLFTSSRDKTVQIYDTKDPRDTAFAQKVTSWIVIEEILSVSNWEDDKMLVCGSSGVLRVYDSTNGELLSEAAKYPHALYSCHYLARQSEALLVTADQCLVFYCLASGSAPKHRRTLAGNLDAVADIRWLDGGLRFVVATNSMHPRIYKRGSNFCEELQGHTDIIGSLAVSSDSRLVASAGKDKSIRIWYVRGPKSRCLGLLSGHSAYIMSVAFTHTVTAKSSLLLLISSDAEGFVRVWNCSPLLDIRRAHTKMLKNKKLVGSSILLSFAFRISLLFTLVPFVPPFLHILLLSSIAFSFGVCSFRLRTPMTMRMSLQTSFSIWTIQTAH